MITSFEMATEALADCDVPCWISIGVVSGAISSRGWCGVKIGLSNTIQK